MISPTEQEISTVLLAHYDPYLGSDYRTAHLNPEVRYDELGYHVSLTLGFPIAGYQTLCEQALRDELINQLGSGPASVSVRSLIKPHRIQTRLTALSEIKNVIAVASGKGGVGKSTTAVNLACALAQQGASVGLLDADIYGPSQPQMLGTYERPVAKDERMEPVWRHGIQSMSMGYLVDQKAAMIWRGPMVSTALQQLLRDTAWKALDYLIVDLPPGTGDVQLTLAQRVPLSAAVIVTTPQDLALLDARRAIGMFEKVNVPVLGIIENMSTHICAQCGYESAIFGKGGGASIAQEYGVRALGQVPLSEPIRKYTDSGEPVVIGLPHSEVADTYQRIARTMAAQLSLQRRDFSGKFPSIVLSNE